MKRIFLAVTVVLFFLSCSDFRVKEKKISEAFIYISHTRVDSNDSIFDKVYEIDFSRYGLTLLGGDLAQYSFENENIGNHLDDIFDLKSPNTILSIGNHDTAPDSVFYKYTNKRKYGLHQKDDISFIVVDSQDSLSSIVGKQKEFLFKVLDTVSTQKVILLSHKLIFMDQHPKMDELIDKTCNSGKGDCFHCHNTNNFMEEVYPRLVKLRSSGKEVFFIGGDLGKKTSSFEHKDKNGIIFLGNGFWYKKDENFLLLFKNEAEIQYKFIHIDTLLKYQDSVSHQDLMKYS